MKIKLSTIDIDTARDALMDLLRTEHGLTLAEGDVLRDLIIEPLSTYHAYISALIEQVSSLGTIKGISDLYDEGLISKSEMSDAVSRVAFDLGIPFTEGRYATGSITITVSDASRVYEIHETDVIKNKNGQRYSPIGAPLIFGPGVSEITFTAKALVVGIASNTSATEEAASWTLNPTITPYVSRVEIGKMTGGADPDTVEGIIDRIDLGEVAPSLLSEQGVAALLTKNPDFGSRIKGSKVIGAGHALMRRDLVTWNGVPFHTLGMANIYVDGVMGEVQETLNVDASGQAPLPAKPAFRILEVKAQDDTTLTRVNSTVTPGPGEYTLVPSTPTLFNSSRQDGFLQFDPATHGSTSVTVRYETLIDWDAVENISVDPDYRPVASDILMYVPYAMHTGISGTITVVAGSPLDSSSISAALGDWIKEEFTIGSSINIYNINNWINETYPTSVTGITDLKISVDIWGDDGILYSSSDITDTSLATYPSSSQVGIDTARPVLDTTMPGHSLTVVEG